jgi:hypothetical protein
MAAFTETSVAFLIPPSFKENPQVPHRRQFLRHASAASLLAAAPSLASRPSSAGVPSQPAKIKDLIIYHHPQFYCAFPSVVCRPDGELLVAFRRAPDRKSLGEESTSHTDPNSYLVLVRSKDNARTWSTEPELIFAHPYGGSQDPCMVQLKDGSIVCTSYGWALLKPEAAAKMTVTPKHGNFVFLGGYTLISKDSGRSWQGPYLPPSVPSSKNVGLFNKPLPAYNRGALCQGRDGRLFWVVAEMEQHQPQLTSVHLMISTDQGRTWKYSCPVARDSRVTFNETSIYETLKGDLVAFIRTAQFDDHTVIARSTDGGKSFHPWQDAGFQGHPHHALRLLDQRVLLVYGYRHQPFGIRARILDAECTNAPTAPEIVLREDGGTGDLGYPWAALMKDGRVLVTYYFNQKDGTRHIAGSIVQI